jgi:hypothetical protein
MANIATFRIEMKLYKFILLLCASGMLSMIWLIRNYDFEDPIDIRFHSYKLRFG